MAHTPGPWLDTARVLNVGRVISIKAHAERPCGASVDPVKCRERFQKVIAYVGNHHCAFELGESEANACLIAAAPELLETLKEAKRALEQASEYLNSNGMTVGAVELAQLHAFSAIAKAEGR